LVPGKWSASAEKAMSYEPDRSPFNPAHPASFPVSPGALKAIEVRELLRKDDPLILEVGANFGQTTVELLLAMPRATVHAFEPDPRAAANFRRYITGHPRLHLHECAVGAVDGTVVFNQSGGASPETGDGQDWDQSGSIRQPRNHLRFYPWVHFKKQIEVPIVTLDSWAEQHNISQVDFIWADVQGAESDLIQGATRLLKSVRYLYTEYSNVEMYEGQVDLPGLVRMLPDFELVRRYPWDVLLRNRLCP
jgi:FkbM family methyltransferase